MQIWRTIRLAPGTSRMRERLVSLRCLVLTMFHQKKSCFVVDLLRFLSPSLRVKSSIAVSRSPRGENRRRKGVHNRRRNCFQSLFVSFQAGRSGSAPNPKYYFRKDANLKLFQKQFNFSFATSEFSSSNSTVKFDMLCLMTELVRGMGLFPV